MASCIVAFHVTCAFDHGLEMRTTLAENDEVRFKSFCLEHSANSSATASATANVNNPSGAANGNPANANGNSAHAAKPDDRHSTPPSASERPAVTGPVPSAAERDQAEREQAGQRKQKLQELEDEFYLLVDPGEVAEGLGLPAAHVDFLYQFWKLRRKSNCNRPLVVLKRDEVDNLDQQEQDVLYRRLQLFTHLRQDLER
ncbi:E3 ubiquitin-protein ligase Jade-2-like, partial [Osmerus eperlanus]|uniref:E3 ubiquitin-protein ligase Jade-2-like n=1 Tax=Osmerus eperlanus TaxID=29151 RepID=UPI002E0F3912